MSFLSRLSLANRSIIALASIAILLFGAYVIPALKQELYPSLSFPAISVIASYPGASPAIVEQDVTGPLEKNIQGLQGVESITSYSNDGSSVILVQYDYSTDLDQASQKLSQQINRTQGSLPSGVTPQVQTFNISEQPVMRLAVSSGQDTAKLATDLKSIVVPAFQGISGVASVDVTGVRDQIVTVRLDADKLKKAGISSNQVQSALQTNNSTVPAGELSNNEQTLSIGVGNTFKSLDDLKNLIVGQKAAAGCTQPSGSGGSSTPGGSGQVPPGNGQFPGTGAPTQQAPTDTQGSTGCTTATTDATPVKLSEVASVELSLAPSTTLTRTNGKESLGVSITKGSNGNAVSISNELQSRIPDLEKKLGSGAKITIISDQAPSISNAIDGLVREGLIGAIFAILVIFVFLFSIRSTLVAAISIPLSIVMALIGLWATNFTLNLFTLGGLTIAIGRVIDDSIVVLENIYRHLGNNEDKKVAIPEAVREVAGAVTSSTLTTVAVFLPIAFTGGIIGQLFKPFSVTVSIALLASLFVSLTIIPVLAYWFLKAPKKHHGQTEQVEHVHESFLEKAYVPMVRWVTGHRVITIVAAFALFFGSLTLIPSLGTNFFNQQEQSAFSITQKLPVNSSINKANEAAKKVESVLAGVKDIKFYQVTIGSSGGGLSALTGGSGGTSTVNYSITAREGVDANKVQREIQDGLKTLTDAGTLTLSAGSGGPGGGGGLDGSTLSINVQASSDSTLKEAAQQVLEVVEQTANTKNASSNLSDASPKVNVNVDPKKAAKYGLSASQVGQLLRQVYSGSTVTTVTLDGTQRSVKLYLGSPATSVEELKNIKLSTQGGSVKLSDVADVNEGKGPTQITHIDGTRTATISATITSQNTGSVSNEVQSKLRQLSLPDGASYSLGGVTSSQSEAFSGLGIALLAAIVLVYIIMVGTFRNLVQPLILLVSIPFAATGSIVLMLLTHTPLGVPSLIGLLMLVGIVVTNAIVLLDLVHQYRMKGMEAQQAVIEGGRRRLRPILMTASATILALLPMASGLSHSSGFIAAPLAITVIGGLTSSTILTLLLVPTLYMVIEGKGKRRGKEEEVVAETEVVTEQAPA